MSSGPPTRLPGTRKIALLGVSFGSLFFASCNTTNADHAANAAAPSAAAVVATRDELADPGPRARLFRAGHDEGELLVTEAVRRGLSIVPLGDDWAPRVLAEDPQLGALGAQPYRETYLALANERLDGEDSALDRARADRYFELYGISPSLRVMRTRLGDDARHACHDAVHDETLEDLHVDLAPWGDLAARRALVRSYDNLKRALPTIRDVRRARYATHRVRELGPKIDGVRAVQAHLRCDGLLSRRAEDGVYDAWTSEAVKAYQRRHMIPSWGLLDEETRAALRKDSRELDFAQLLRALRERVVDATGVIEDGSAQAHFGTVLGRAIDAHDLRVMERLEPLPDAAPDLVSPATEQAALALGWTSPAAARAFLDVHDTQHLDAALPLPAPPAYHRAHMDLHAELDRGDVWYDYPFGAGGRAHPQPVRRRPTVTLYAREGGRDIALVRWNTTIGGWKPEQIHGGRVGLRYKGSEVGPRVWRDLVATPAWLPPESTPDEDLVRRSGTRWVANTDVMGPGYASAYGLVMMVHHRVVPSPARRAEPGETMLVDRGIRVHGSVSYASILRGQSHGCHRLFNHLAVRLGGFVLAHRDHIRRGPEAVRYQRRVVRDGDVSDIRIANRGVRFELTPPVPVFVHEGTVQGRAHEPPRGLRPLRSVLAARAAAALDAE